jgi:hypothetical protein
VLVEVTPVDEWMKPPLESKEAHPPCLAPKPAHVSATKAATTATKAITTATKAILIKVATPLAA